MAQEAHKRASKVMDAETEARLAKIINSDLEQLREKAESQGVLAYGLKPVRRERLNERFLQNTLKGVGFANKKADEDHMWASRRPEAKPPGARGDRSGRSYMRSERGAEDDELEGSFSRKGDAAGVPSGWAQGGLADADDGPPAKRRKGRGGRGLKSEDAGPFLPAESAAERDRETDPVAEARPRTTHGPARPAWLTRPDSPPLQTTMHQSMRSLDEQMAEGAAISSRGERKHKHKKKEKHKHKHRRQSGRD